MELEQQASEMGDKNPILQQRRGTAKGFAFSEDVSREQNQSQVEESNAEIVEESNSSTNYNPNLNLLK